VSEDRERFSGVNMREFVYRAETLGYHCSVFRLEKIVGEPIPHFPKIGELDVLNSMLNIVANGDCITILPHNSLVE